MALSEDADSPYPMDPDDETDEAKATAKVNTEMVVMSNTTAVIVPDNFADNAAAVTVHAGENMPFAFVSWEAMQSQVVAGGATFKIMRVTLGANQEMEPTGDVAYVTCGPFECVNGDGCPGAHDRQLRSLCRLGSDDRAPGRQGRQRCSGRGRAPPLLQI